MFTPTTSYWLRRHPFWGGVAILILLPYVLTFCLLYGIAFVLVTVADLATSR